jgi:hypothetical protein
MQRQQWVKKKQNQTNNNQHNQQETNKNPTEIKGCTQVFKKESVDDMCVALSAVLLIVTIGQKKTQKA